MRFARLGKISFAWRGLFLVTLCSLLNGAMLGPKSSPLDSVRATRSAVAGNYDIIVFGGTPSGVAAAIAANQTTSRVLLISDRVTVGGAISNGLGAVDIGARFAVTGTAREFFTKVQSHYGDHTMWRTEPHVAEAIFRNMLTRTNITVSTSRLLLNTTVVKDRITCLTLDGGTQVCAKQFIDASYTGDLIAQSQATNVLGHTDLYAYQEPEATRRHFARMGSFRDLDPNQVESAMRAIPYIDSSATMPDLKGMVLEASPSWTYRLCLTRGKKRPFTPGANYNQYVHAWRILIKAQYPKGTCRHWCRVKTNGTIQTKLWQLVRLPNGKYDLNAGSAQLSNFPIGRDYFLKPQTRQSTEKRLKDYLNSFLYFAQNDAAVPEFERQAMTGMGLCADEFTDNSNWPYAPYIRGGVRLVGRSILTTTNIMQRRTSANAVAIGSYLLDTKSSHIVYWKGSVYRDVGLFLKAPVYEIPYETLVPKNGPNNLLSSVNISASATAFGSVRVEAQFMELGQAAGSAAAIAIQNQLMVADIDVSDLRTQLGNDGLVTSVVSLCRNLDRTTRKKQFFNLTTCQPERYTQDTPYDSLYGRLPR